MNKITQAELAQYHSLMKEEQKIKENRLELRLNLIQRLSSKCSVEEGSFSVKYEKRLCKSFSKIVIIDSMGEDYYNNLFNSITPVEREYLRVINSKKTDT